jgi:hypothetical protein
MSIKLRNAVAATLVVVLGSSVLANREWVIYLDHGGPWARPQAQQEVFFASADPTTASQSGPVAQGRQLEEALEAMGIVVD